MAVPRASRPCAVRLATPSSRARRNTALYRLKTPSHQIAIVRITRWPKGWTLPPQNGSQVTVRPPSLRGSLAQEEHAEILHQRCFHNLHLPISSWTNCEPGCAALNRCCGSGWPPILAPSFFPCFSWVREPKTWHTYSSTPCDRAWPLAASRSLPVMGSISTSMPSHLILVSGS